MLHTFMAVLYIFLYITPFSILRYYPFLDKLRLPLNKVIAIFLTLIILQAGFFVYLINNIHITNKELQIYRMSWVIILAVYSFMVIKEFFFKQFFFYLITIIYASMICGTAHFIEARIFHSFASKHPYTIANIAIIVQIIITFPLMFSLTKNHFKKFADLVETDIWKIIWIIPFMFYCIGMIFTVDLNNASKWQYIVTRYLVCIGSFCVCYVLLKTLKQLANNATLKQRLYFIQQQLIIQEKKYEALTVNIEKTRKARHDLHHHFLLIERYLKENDKESLLGYLEEQRKSVSLDAQEIICENTAVNVLACYYIRLAKEKGIKTDFKISLKKDIGILNSDLSIIFGNCLENALEACERMTSGNPLIRVRAGIKMEQLVIVIGNSFDGHIICNNGEFYSIKSNGTKGIGISSIQAVAEKYDGEPKFEVIDETVFKVSMVLTPIIH